MENGKGFLSVAEAPFLRFLLPYIAGIAIQFATGGYIIPAVSALAAVLFLIRYYAVGTPRYKYAKSRYFGYAVFAVFLFAGSLNTALNGKRADTAPPASSETAVAIITAPPKEQERSIQCSINVLQFVKQNGEKTGSDMPAALFFQKDSLSAMLKKGDAIIFKEKLQPISGSSNPYGSDFGDMMQKKGYLYSQYVPAGSWEYLGHDSSRTVSDAAQHARSMLVERIESLNMQYRSEALVKALLAGDTSQLTQSMRSSYSVAGLSHILAVSGLHTGIIAYMIYLLLSPLKYIGLRRLIPAISLAVTWGYVYVAGMPPSAVRAGIMASFVLFGEIIGRKGTSVNSLLAAAFLMLVYNPYYLFDVGFQLSYTAVFSIFCFYPLFMAYLPDGNGFRRKLSSVVAVTAAAQTGTLPLCIYYFHQLPVLGIFTNLLVIPLLPFIMALAVITVLLKHWIAIYMLDTSLAAINGLAAMTETLPFSSIDGIFIKPEYVIFLFITVFCTAWGIRTKRSDIITGLACFVFLFTLAESAGRMKDREKYTFAVYDDNDITAINMASPWYNYIITPGITDGGDDVRRMAGTFWFANLFPDVRFASDSITDKGILLSMPYMVFGGEKIVILDSDRFSRYNVPEKRLYVDKVVITWGFNGDFSRVCEFFNIGETIIASNVPWYIRNRILEECSTLRIPCYDIKREGAYVARFGI